MNRTTLTVVGLLLAALIAWTVTRDDDATDPRATFSSHPTTTTAVAPAPPPAAVGRQRELAPADARAERRRARRMALLDVARTRAWDAHGVVIFAGPFDAGTRTQQVTVTPSGSSMTLVEIGRAVARSCRELGDPCSQRDYQFVVATTSGTVPLPPALLRAVPRPQRVAPRTSVGPSDPDRSERPRSHHDQYVGPDLF